MSKALCVGPHHPFVRRNEGASKKIPLPERNGGAKTCVTIVQCLFSEELLCPKKEPKRPEYCCTSGTHTPNLEKNDPSVQISSSSIFAVAYCVYQPCFLIFLHGRLCFLLPSCPSLSHPHVIFSVFGREKHPHVSQIWRAPSVRLPKTVIAKHTPCESRRTKTAHPKKPPPSLVMRTSPSTHRRIDMTVPHIPPSSTTSTLRLNPLRVRFGHLGQTIDTTGSGTV